MKKIIASLAALTMFAAPAIAKPWAYEGEKRWWYWDISPHGSKQDHLVVHQRNARWISANRLRVEFSIRTNASAGRGKRTYQPWVVYDELTRCDGAAVCDPPLFPVISVDDSGKYFDYSSKKWYTHSMTIDCRSEKTSVGQWKSGHNIRTLSFKKVCAYFR